LCAKASVCFIWCFSVNVGCGVSFTSGQSTVLLKVPVQILRVGY
jgi:hypothetical protein